MQSIGLKSKKILGISVTTDSRKAILEYINKYLGMSSEKPMVIVTPNPEQIVAAQSDSLFAKILNQADVALPDGIGLAFVIKQKRIPGVEFMEDLVELAAKRGYTIGLIGGRAGVAVKALECLYRRYTGLKGWAMEPGELPISNTTNTTNIKYYQYYQVILEKILKTRTRMVFVGLGAPKQEYFMESIRYQVSRIKQEKKKNMTHDTLTHDTGLILMSVGGAFDMIAGRTPRAPHAIGAIHLEWLWRLVREPWRWRRQVALGKFFWLVMREKIYFEKSNVFRR